MKLDARKKQDLTHYMCLCRIGSGPENRSVEHLRRPATDILLFLSGYLHSLSIVSIDRLKCDTVEGRTVAPRDRSEVGLYGRRPPESDPMTQMIPRAICSVSLLETDSSDFFQTFSMFHL